MSDTKIEELGGLIKDFKALNDKVLAQQDAQGQGVSLLKETQAKVEDRINVLEATMQKNYLNAQAVQNVSSFNKKEQEMLGSRYPKLVESLTSQEYKELFMEHLYKDKVSLSEKSKKLAGEYAEKTMFLADDSTGGIFAPPEFLNILIRDIVEISPWRSLVTVRNTTKRSVWQPKRTRTTMAVRTAEGGAQIETQNPTFAPIEIPTYKTYARVDISDEDLEDPLFNLESFLREDWSEQFAKLEGSEVTNGTGVGQCTGITTDTTIPEITSTVSAGFSADDLIKLWAVPKSGYVSNFTAVMNRSTISYVRRLKDSANRYLWDMGFNAGPSAYAQGAPMTILGAPVVEIPDMPNLAANAYSVAVGDWKKGYTLVDRINISVLRDPSTLAGQGVVRIFARKRFGGKPVQQEAMAKLKILT